MTKITPVKINCIEQNSSKVSRGGKHSASKSTSSMTSAGNHYVQVENEGTAATQDLLPRLKGLDDSAVLAELASFEGISTETLLSEVERDWGLDGTQLVELFRMAADESENGEDI